jgi:Uma2 family endonuclease
VQKLTKLLLRAIGDRAEVRVQLPIYAADESEPEPDLAVVPPGDYDEAHPDRALLIIEVADSSLRKDRLVKAPLYAASGFGEYWLVDVAAKMVEVYRGPSLADSSWKSITRHGREETLAPEAFPEAALRVADFLR